jgi:hypothetical protein
MPTESGRDHRDRIINSGTSKQILRCPRAHSDNQRKHKLTRLLGPEYYFLTVVIKPAAGRAKVKRRKLVFFKVAWAEFSTLSSKLGSGFTLLALSKTASALHFKRVHHKLFQIELRKYSKVISLVCAHYHLCDSSRVS